MTARQWTREELDRVHPLPEGWAWRLWEGEPMACSGTLEVFADGSEVWGQGRESNMTSLPVDVCLAVILASRGMDSLGAMADAMAVKADESLALSCQAKDECELHIGCASAWLDAAAMLRRGTVAP